MASPASRRCASAAVRALSAALLAVVGCRIQEGVDTARVGGSGGSAVQIVGAQYFVSAAGGGDETFEVFLHNRSGAVVQLGRVFLDGRELPVPADGSSVEALRRFDFGFGGSRAAKSLRNRKDDDVRWFQFYPSTALPPGGHCSLQVNFRGRTRPRSIGVEADGGIVAAEAPRDASPGRAVQFMGFDSALAHAYVLLSPGRPPASVSAFGVPARMRVLETDHGCAPCAVVVDLPRRPAPGEAVLLEFLFHGGAVRRALVRPMPGVVCEATSHLDDDSPLPDDARKRFCFDGSMSVWRIPVDPLCDDVRAKERGFSAAMCLARRRGRAEKEPWRLCGVDFCTALYCPEVWNIYAPMADAVFSKPYRLHWGRNASSFVEEEDAQIADTVRICAPRPVIWVPDRFRRGRALAGDEFSLLAWTALMRGARGVRCHHWKNSAEDPFSGDSGLAEAVAKFTADFRRLRPLVEKLIPVRSSEDRTSHVRTLEGWCGDSGMMLLVRRDAHGADAGAAAEVRCRLPKWLAFGSAVDPLSGKGVDCVVSGRDLSMRLSGAEPFRLVWIPNEIAVDGGQGG